MALYYKQSGELLPERRVIIGADIKSFDYEHRLRIIRRGWRLGRFSGRRRLFWVFLVAAFFSICLALFGLKMIFHGEMEGVVSSMGEVQERSSDKPKKTPRRPHKISLSDIFTMFL